MKKITASIKLAPGNRGFFDPITGINLSLSNSMGYIREDDDITNIKKAIREGKIKIVGGQLPPAINIKPIQKVKKVIKKKEEVKPVEVKKEEAKKFKKQKKVKPAEKIEKKEDIVLTEEPKIKLPILKEDNVKDKPVEAGE